MCVRSINVRSISYGTILCANKYSEMSATYDVRILTATIHVGIFVPYCIINRPILMRSDGWIGKGNFRSETRSGFLMQSKKCFSIEQSDPHIPLRKSTFSTGCAHRIARSKNFLKPTASHNPTKHTITPYNSSDAGLTATVLLLLLLLTTTRRGTSCSPPTSSAYGHPMAAVRVIYDLFTTPLLLLCSLWRLSTKSNATTATMKRMRAPRAPNERFACGKGATKTCLSTASSSLQTP